MRLGMRLRVRTPDASVLRLLLTLAQADPERLTNDKHLCQFGEIPNFGNRVTKKRRQEKPTVTPDDPEVITYRGSICGWCLSPLLTNLSGTVVQHQDGTRYGMCAQARQARSDP